MPRSSPTWLDQASHYVLCVRETCPEVTGPLLVRTAIITAIGEVRQAQIVPPANDTGLGALC